MLGRASRQDNSENSWLDERMEPRTCRSFAMDSLGMISLRWSRVTKQRAWNWLWPLSSSPRIKARKIFTS